MRAIVDQLLGPDRWCSGQRPGREELDTVIFRWPRAETTPAVPLPSSGHVEGGNSSKGERSKSSTKLCFPHQRLFLR